LSVSSASRWVVEAAYVGNRSYDLSVDTDIFNAVPRQYLPTRPERDEATIDFLTTNAANSSTPSTTRNRCPEPQPHELELRQDHGAVQPAAQLEAPFLNGISRLLCSFAPSAGAKKHIGAEDACDHRRRLLSIGQECGDLALTEVGETPIVRTIHAD
jgi:hypothetical protein